MAVITITPEQGWNALADAVVQAQPGDEIQLQEGEYLAKSQIVLTSGLRLYGKGNVKITNLNLGDLVIISEPNIELQGITFINSQDYALLKIDGAQQLSIKKCSFNSSAWSSIILSESQQISIEDCCIVSETIFIFTAISVLYSKNITINRCIVNNNHYGIYCIGCAEIVINHNHISNCKYAVWLDSCSSFGIVRNICCNSYTGILIFYDESTISYNSITENNFYNNYEYGMLVITKNCYNFYPRPSEYTKDLHSNGCIYNSQCDTADSNGVHIINNAFHHNVISILVNINIVFLKDNLLIGNKRNGVFCFENYEEIIKNGNRLIEYSITCLKQCLENSKYENPDNTAVLLSFLRSQGCPDCFRDFWNSHFSIDASNHQFEHTVPTDTTGTRSEIYKVVPQSEESQPDATVQIVSIPLNDPILHGSDLKHNKSSLAKFNALLPAFARKCSLGSDLPTWSVALITSDEQEFYQWFQDDTINGKKRIDALTSGILKPPNIRMRVIDFSGYGFENDKIDTTQDELGFIERELLKGKIDTAGGKWRARLEALAAIPMSEFLYLLVVLILLSYWHTTILSQLRSLIVGCQSMDIASLVKMLVILVTSGLLLILFLIETFLYL